MAARKRLFTRTWLSEHFVSLLSLSVALVAVGLSQFRPLYTYFDQPDFSVSAPPVANIWNGWGNLAISRSVQVTNRGRAAGIIRRIAVALIEESRPSNRWVLPGAQYYMKPQSVSFMERPNVAMMNEVLVQPDTSWENVVDFFRPFDAETQRRLQQITLKVQQQLSPPDNLLNPPETVDDALAAEIGEVVDRNLAALVPGRYVLVEAYWFGETESPSEVKYFRFEIQQQDIDSLKQVKENYRWGFGLVKPPALVPAGFVANLTLLKESEAPQDLPEILFAPATP